MYKLTFLLRSNKLKNIRIKIHRDKPSERPAGKHLKQKSHSEKSKRLFELVNGLEPPTG